MRTAMPKKPTTAPECREVRVLSSGRVGTLKSDSERYIRELEFATQQLKAGVLLKVERALNKTLSHSYLADEVGLSDEQIEVLQRWGWNQFKDVSAYISTIITNRALYERAIGKGER
jgi:hypothetical protein